MEVISRETIDTLGHTGRVVKVADGHARALANNRRQR